MYYFYLLIGIYMQWLIDSKLFNLFSMLSYQYFVELPKNFKVTISSKLRMKEIFLRLAGTNFTYANKIRFSEKSSNGLVSTFFKYFPKSIRLTIISELLILGQLFIKKHSRICLYILVRMYCW